MSNRVALTKSTTINIKMFTEGKRQIEIESK